MLESALAVQLYRHNGHEIVYVLGVLLLAKHVGQLFFVGILGVGTAVGD